MSVGTNDANTAIRGKRLAVVVGVNQTKSSILPPLSNAINDAKAMAEVLAQKCGFELLASPLLGQNATSNAIRGAVFDLTEERAEEDFLLFYFSGHGQPLIIEEDPYAIYLGSSNFMDRQVTEDKDRHISLGWLRERLYEGTGAGRVLLMMDCCFSGNYGSAAANEHLKKLRKLINTYFHISTAESRSEIDGLRVVLTATSYNKTTSEGKEHSLLTGYLLPALRGDIDEILEVHQQGQISLQGLHRYLERVMPTEQKPSLSGDYAGRDCILASFPDRAAQLLRQQRRVPGAERPTTYIPFARNPLFQPRPQEFERLEAMLVAAGKQEKPLRLGLVGVVGMGGIGKTQLAVELAYRCLQRFPAGIFWTPATGETLFEWQRHFAELALNTGYLPPDDDVTHAENERRRAQHFCRYLAEHTDALLILDNVEQPTLVTSALAVFAGRELACPVLYTSRNTSVPAGVSKYSVERLPEDAALRVLLGDTRPQLLAMIEAGQHDQKQEVEAAKELCRRVDCLPLALVHLNGLLRQDQWMKLARLREALTKGGIHSLKETLFTTFRFSWEQVRDENTRRLFKLACYYPAATPAPLWLLGLAAGLGEECDSLEPLGKARVHLRELSLIEELSGEQVRLHPLVREFGRGLVAKDGDDGADLVQEAGRRLADACSNLNWLEERACQQGYLPLLEQVRAVRDYLDRLGVTGRAEEVERVERWLDRESYLLADQRWWPGKLPELFYQQLANRSLEAGRSLAGNPPVGWLRQMAQVGAEDPALLHMYPGHSDSVNSVAFSPDRQQVLSGSRDGTLRLWETGSGRELARFAGHSGPVNSVAFFPDGRQVLSGSSDQTVRLWEVSSGRELKRFEGHSGPVNSVAFSPDRQQVLSGSSDGRVRLWEISSGRELARFAGHSGPVNSVAFSPDGWQVLSGSWDGRVRLWETSSGRELRRFEGHNDRVSSVAFSPDGREVLSGSWDQTLRLWEVSSGRELKRFEGHSDSVNSVAFSPDGREVLSGSWDRTLRLWEASSGRELARFEGHSGPVNSVAFFPNGREVLSGSWDQTLRLWEASSGRELRRFAGHSGPVNSVAFSPDGREMLSGSSDRTLRLWEASSGRELKRFEGHSLPVNSVAFSPDGREVLSGADDQTLRLWETSSGRELRRFAGHNHWVRSVAFSPNGREVLSGADDQTLRLWEASSGRELRRFAGHSGAARSAAFSPDGRQVLSGSHDGTLQLWEVSSGRELRRFKGHRSSVWSSVRSVTFSPDGRQVLSGSDDQTLRLWEASSGRELARFAGHSGAVNSVALSPDGRIALACDTHGWVFFWQVGMPDQGRLMGIYVAVYEIGAVHWQDATHVILADKGGPGGRPHFYQLKLEGL